MAMSMRRREEGMVRPVAARRTVGAKHNFDPWRHGGDSGEFRTLT